MKVEPFYFLTTVLFLLCNSAAIYTLLSFINSSFCCRLIVSALRMQSEDYIAWHLTTLTIGPNYTRSMTKHARVDLLTFKTINKIVQLDLKTFTSKHSNSHIDWSESVFERQLRLHMLRFFGFLIVG